MLYRFFKKYLSSIVLFAALLGSMHHHHDLKVHSDCKICVIHAKLLNTDTPSDPVYLSKLTIYKEAIRSELFVVHKSRLNCTLHPRAPPSFS